MEGLARASRGGVAGLSQQGLELWSLQRQAVTLGFPRIRLGGLVEVHSLSSEDQKVG